MSVRISQNRDVQHVRDVEVVHEPRASGEEAQVFAATHPRADVRLRVLAGVHRARLSHHSPRCFSISSARRIIGAGSTGVNLR
jgi:hypothetical protein